MTVKELKDKLNEYPDYFLVVVNDIDNDLEFWKDKTTLSDYITIPHDVE